MSNGVARAGIAAYPTTAEADMAAFDDLPAPVRACLREAPVNVAAPPLQRFWRHGRGDCVERATAILDAVAERVAEAVAPDVRGSP